MKPAPTIREIRVEFLVRVLLIIALYTAIILILSGCASSDTLRIPRAPAWQQPRDATFRPVQDVTGRARQLAPGALVSSSDSVFVFVSKSWLDRYVSWTWEVAKVVGLRYTPESFDCDNFASLFTEIVAKKASDAGVNASPLVAKVVVQQPDGSRHALVAVATDEGVFIVEPQPDAGPFRVKPLSAYPNRILSVEFGIFNP